MKTRHPTSKLLPTIIAVDFDGTCVTHEYPNVGRDIGAAPVLKELDAAGHKLILWTMRHDKGLQDAIDWFTRNGIRLWDANHNPEQSIWTDSPKVYAHIYIDDAALGAPLIYVPGERPHIDWDAVRTVLERIGLIKRPASECLEVTSQRPALEPTADPSASHSSPSQPSPFFGDSLEAHLE